MDAKNRIFIPAKFREELGEDIVISPSLRKKCLVVYSIKEWESYLAPIKAGLKREELETVMRYINSRALRLFLDSTGRVQLTPELVKHAELTDKQIQIVGCGDYAEIWDAETYEKLMAQTNDEDILGIVGKLGY